jgi:hypothetical protein
MAKLTLLDMVQRILSSLDSDPVNSYTDTIESEQVAFIIRDTYADLINNIEIPEHRTLVTLTALADAATPTHMTIPAGIRRIDEVRYNKVKSGSTARDYERITYVEPEVFLHRTLMRDSDASTNQIVTVDGGEVLIQNDKAPEFYSSFDDETLIFDSFDSGVDSTLQSSKFIVWAIQSPVFTLSDVFIPDIDENLFPLLLNESKSVAYIELNQRANPKAEQVALRQKIRWQSDRHNISKSLDNSYGRPNYGRASRRRV